MMTFEDLAREAIALTSSPAPMPLVVQWASTMINELSRVKKVQHFKVLRELYIPPVLNTGLVSATRDSANLTGNAAALAAWPGGHQLVGRYIRIQTVWYPIGDQQGTVLKIRPPALFAENSVTLHSYVIQTRYLELDEDVDLLDEHMTHGRFGSPIPVITKDQMDALYPGRWSAYASSGGVPQHVCEVEVSLRGRRQVEVYPYSQTSELLYYNAWLKPPAYTYDQYLPNFINYAALVEGVKHRLYEYHAAREQEPQRQAVLMNLAARQRTIWQDARAELFLHEAAAAQGGLSMMLLKDRFVATGRDINNAWSAVWSREP